MSTIEALKAFQDAATSLRASVTADKLALETKVRDAKAVLDSVTGEQSQHAAMEALADGIDLLTRGEKWVSVTPAVTFRHYVIATAAGLLVGGGVLAAKVFGLI